MVTILHSMPARMIGGANLMRETADEKKRGLAALFQIESTKKIPTSVAPKPSLW
jgi:hypothetical protein